MSRIARAVVLALLSAAALGSRAASAPGPIPGGPRASARRSTPGPSTYAEFPPSINDAPPGPGQGSPSDG